MRVFVDTKFGPTFTFDLDRHSKVFDIKKSIENSQGIPVSMQTLYFDGFELSLDHYQLKAYRIVNNSRLLLEVRDDHVNNQMQYPYAIQGFVPSMATSNYYDHMPPFHASESFLNQDLRMMPPRSNQILHQTQISPVPLSHASAYFYNQYQRTMNQLPPSHATSETFYNQDQRAMNQVPPSHASEANFYNQDQRTMNQVPPSHASEANFYNQDWLVSNDDQVFHQPEESVLESFSMDEFLERVQEPWTAQETRKMQGIWPETTGEEVVNVQESSGRANKNQDLFQPPQKLTVTMTQYDKPGGNFLVDVNASDNVEELRKQLEKYQLDLPAKGYFFMHKERVLDDGKSFSMNRVANGDTIEILPEPDIKDFCT
ncbi:unnamed protein product [Eruca vesicaria subsp. sativa]|uniref:Ubiquitin-like domain-containing protein n=1 Tax=Eruca vesicaria subsp. sativa TaxID=29727 RepID=A0ABC8KY41_ERUVS|nr:unnamed protein product [Eruca vesicaria subsp. sativa]